ncbi:uncharacterized protein OCT59_030079 [Rhizophagus irregularis]|nr:hypothetical protein OCT59_030079 [Rhizophagus irregularis]
MKCIKHDLFSHKSQSFLSFSRTKKKRRKMPNIINAITFLRLKDLLFQKIIEFFLEKIYKIFLFVLVCVVIFIIIIFHLSISNLYNQTRKQVENYGQSSITFNSIQIVELPITELRMPIKHSPLNTYSELPDKLIKYIDKARIFDKDLQILQTRTKSSLDKLITYLCALKISVNHNKANTNDAYYQTTTFIETELREMILVFQYARRSLADLDEISVELHDLTTYELTRYKREYNKLLDSFWSKLGGNSRKIQEYEENLTLLKDLDKRLRMALSHIGTTSRNLESFLLNLDELRKLVSVTEMPIKIHIEIVWKGVVRLISEGGVGDVSLIGILINSIESSWSKTSVPTLIKFILSV